MNTHCEYTIILISARQSHLKKSIEKLNEMAAQGWKIVSGYPVDNNGNIAYTLERYIVKQ